MASPIGGIDIYHLTRDINPSNNTLEADSLEKVAAAAGLKPTDSSISSQPTSVTFKEISWPAETLEDFKVPYSLLVKIFDEADMSSDEKINEFIAKLCQHALGISIEKPTTSSILTSFAKLPFVRRKKDCIQHYIFEETHFSGVDLFSAIIQETKQLIKNGTFNVNEENKCFSLEDIEQLEEKFKKIAHFERKLGYYWKKSESCTNDGRSFSDYYDYIKNLEAKEFVRRKKIIKETLGTLMKGIENSSQKLLNTPLIVWKRILLKLPPECKLTITAKEKIYDVFRKQSDGTHGLLTLAFGKIHLAFSNPVLQNGVPNRLLLTLAWW